MLSHAYLQINSSMINHLQKSNQLMQIVKVELVNFYGAVMSGANLLVIKQGMHSLVAKYSWRDVHRTGKNVLLCSWARAGSRLRNTCCPLKDHSILRFFSGGKKRPLIHNQLIRCRQKGCSNNFTLTKKVSFIRRLRAGITDY